MFKNIDKKFEEIGFIKTEENEYQFAPSIELDIFSYNPLDITGYGSTKEEALDNFKRKFDFLMKEWQLFEKMLFETDAIENDILEVDCLGNPLNCKLIKIY